MLASDSYQFFVTAVFSFIRHDIRVIIEILAYFNWIYKIICVQKIPFFETN